MKSLRRTPRTQSTKYSSSQGAARARWPLKMTRSKQESTATITRINLVTKRDGVFMASSSGRGREQTPFWREDAVLVQPIWLRLCRVASCPRLAHLPPLLRLEIVRDDQRGPNTFTQGQVRRSTSFRERDE